MIVTTLYFDRGISPECFVTHLGSLQGDLKLLYFSSDEGKVDKKNLISDEELFKKFLLGNSFGFFLYSECGVCVNVSIGNIGYIDVSMWLNETATRKYVESFIEVLVPLKPIYGFACEWDEYKHRNKHYITIGQNHIESWVGRDIDKYVSGLYWYTLFSEVLLEKHSIDLDEIKSLAQASVAYENDTLHLFNFFEVAEQWPNLAEKLDKACEDGTGFFSKKSVDSAAKEATNYMSLCDIIDDWK